MTSELPPDGTGPVPEPPIAVHLAEQLPVSRAVYLFARAAKGRASYDWQSSKGEEPWLFGPRTVRADVRSYELVRYRRVKKGGVSDGNQVVYVNLE